jgi:hypothetical protein
VGAQRESAAHRGLTVNHGDGDGAFVTGSGADTLEDFGSHVLIVAIDDHGFESPASQFADSRICIAAQFDGNFQIAQDPSQHPRGFFVRTQNQSLQTHRGRTPLTHSAADRGSFPVGFFFVK